MQEGKNNEIPEKLVIYGTNQINEYINAILTIVKNV